MPAAEEGAPPECPVCYELLKAHSRTLSCGHVFCHDCLAKTLLSGARRGTVTRRSITCPVCRHLTFVWPLNANSLGADDGRLIQVPPPSTDSRPHSVHGREARPGRSVWSWKWLPGAFTRVRAVTPAVTPQIFTISGEGRPMEDGDVVSVVSAVGAVGESLTRSGQSENRLSACGVLSLLLILTSLTVASAVLRCILMGYS